MSLDYLSHNVVLVGLIGAMLTGSLLWLFKAIPKAVVSAIIRSITVKVTITSDDKVFEWINDWLAYHPYTLRARLLKVSSRSLQSDWTLAPGFGWHLVWKGGFPMLLKREVKESSGEVFSGRPQEKFIITTLGRSQARLRAAIEQADNFRQRHDKLEVRLWQENWWRPLARKAKRPLDSVFLDEGMLEELIAEASWFFESGEWHRKLGIPHRLGWLFEGEPGTGKTTVAMALASRFDRPICILNLATITNDNMLLAAFTSAEPNCVILLEDVDTIRVTRERDCAPPPRVIVPKQSDPDKKKEVLEGITLSGLLNAIDGVASTDGRLLILTTNKPEQLDAALIRPNRVDRRWRFGTLPPSQVKLMVLRFFPGRDDVADQMANIASERKTMTASDWQSLMVRSRKDPEALALLLGVQADKRAYFRNG